MADDFLDKRDKGYETFNNGSSTSIHPAKGFTNAAKSGIEIYHLVTQQFVIFPAFITTFSDDHQSEWNEEHVYGRMDDLATFRRTKRMMTLEFDVPSVNYEEAKKNFEQIALLKKFLYPAYDKVGAYTTGNALAISSSPFVRIKFLNYSATSISEEKGLLSTLKNINFSPDQEMGTHVQKEDNVLKAIPKLFKISLSYNVFHEHTTGWVKNGNSYTFGGDKNIQDNYPYFSKNNDQTPGVGGATPAPSSPVETTRQASEGGVLGG